MIANPSHLKRWAVLLSRAAGNGIPPASASADTPRGRVVRALYRVRQLRAGRVDPFCRSDAVPPIAIRSPAANGASIATAVWEAYADFMAADPSAAPVLESAIMALDPTALIAGITDNPEPWWQSEMVILHGLHSFALIRRNEELLQQTLRCAQFHLEEIQPDHATNEVWSIHAYASHRDGSITAETLLHAAHMHDGGVLGDTSRLLAHDATAALEAYLAP